MLKRNFTRFCNINNNIPIVALTGTASQLVLIDLKRELGINEITSIIRPNTFERKELKLYVRAVPRNGKLSCLEQFLQNELSVYLGIANINNDA
jgi:ATP-dependent DNA helicase RecQ